MRVAEYKQISTRIEQRVIHHDAEYAEDGTIIKDAWCETVDVMVPVMGMEYRDATPEEEAESERQQAELPEPELTPEERLSPSPSAGGGSAHTEPLLPRSSRSS